MALKRTAQFGTIAYGLGRLRSSCAQRGFLGFFDNHGAARYFFRQFPNTAFGLNLLDVNQIKPNHPAIDLGDTEKGIAYQVTSERGSDKVQHTLEKFVRHGLDKKYSQLKILVIGERLKSYSAVQVTPGSGFIFRPGDGRDWHP